MVAEGQSAPAVCRSPTGQCPAQKTILLHSTYIQRVLCFLFLSHVSELKNKNAPRPNLKFRFDKQSHSAMVSLSRMESQLPSSWLDLGWLLFGLMSSNRNFDFVVRIFFFFLHFMTWLFLSATGSLKAVIAAGENNSKWSRLQQKNRYRKNKRMYKNSILKDVVYINLSSGDNDGWLAACLCCSPP